MAGECCQGVILILYGISCCCDFVECFWIFTAKSNPRKLYLTLSVSMRNVFVKFLVLRFTNC